MLHYVYILYTHFFILGIGSFEATAAEDFIGTWKFDRQQFSKQHPFYPKFIVDKAMKARLVLTKQTFTQYKNNDTKLYPKEKLKLLRYSNSEWVFQRENQSGNVKEFRITKTDGDYYYHEKNKTYLIHRDLDFKKGNEENS